MNRRGQIDIIQAHIQGKDVWVHKLTDTTWYPMPKGEVAFDFQDCEYEVRPQRIEAFMFITERLLETLKTSHELVSVAISRRPRPSDGNTRCIRVNFLEPLP